MLQTSSLPAPARLASWPADVPLARRAWTFVVAFAELLWMDVCLHLGYATIRRATARVAVAPVDPTAETLQLVRVAVRDACVFYFKRAMCLQRSAVVTRMLRRRGVGAELVVGYLPTPIFHHAWVEVEGAVVWDQLTLQQFVRVVDRI